MYVYLSHGEILRIQTEISKTSSDFIQSKTCSDETQV